jgi:hypothetical protein
MIGKPNAYRDKLPPIFFDLAELNRDFEIRLAEIQRECDGKLASYGPNPPNERRSEVGTVYRAKTVLLEAYLDKKLRETQARHRATPFNKLAYSYFDFSKHQDTPDDILQRIFEYMHWERHGESFRKTSHLIGEGDVDALRRVQRTDEDRFRVYAGKGPIKKYQGDIVHRQILELILCFEMTPLTEEERADCADDYCACGKTHDPDALDKQYRRFKKQLQASLTPNESA